MPRWFNTLQLHRRWKQTTHRRTIAKKYKILHEIGRGASGIVHLAVDTKTNVRYVNIFAFFRSLMGPLLTTALIIRPSKNSANQNSNDSINLRYCLNQDLLAEEVDLHPHPLSTIP